MSIEQTLVADGDGDDYVEQGLAMAEVEANLGDLEMVRLNQTRTLSEAALSYTELTRFKQAPALGWVALQRARTVMFEDN